MGELIKYLFIFIISFNLLSASNNQMDEFFSLQKEKNSISKDINLIYLTYSLGYPEKSKQKLYILLDKFTKEEFDKNIKDIYSILKNKDFDKEILSSIEFLVNGKKHPKMNKEILTIYNSKKPKNDVPAERNGRSSLSESRKELSVTSKELSVTSKELSVTTPKRNKLFSKKIELAIVLSEWLDDFDIDNSIKYSLMLKEDSYYKVLAPYLKYLKTKDYKELESVDQKSPTLYHFLISIYKKEKNNEKVLIYTSKLKEEFPYYLKYNKI